MTKEGNKYYRRSRISEWKFRLLVKYFALDMSATDAARLIGLTRKTVTVIFLKIRRRIADERARQSPLLTGSLKRDESRSCAICICGKKRTCGISNKTPVFAVLNHNGHIYTEMIPDCRKPALRALIRGHGLIGSLDEFNGWHGFDALVDAGYAEPFKIKQSVSKDHQQLLEPSARNIENFWSFARRRLEKFYGVQNRTFYLHLKECEWRYNERERDLYAGLLKLLRNHPL